MKTFITAVAITLGVTPALAGDYYNDQCASRQGSDVWSLSLSTIGDHAVQLWREDRARVRIGTYDQNGDDVLAHLEDITLRLHIASGDAAWRAGDARGTFLCRYVGDTRPARWQDAPVVASRDPGSDEGGLFDPGTWADAPPAVALAPPAPALDGKLCDFQGTCYPAGNSPSAPTGGAPNSVPIEVTPDNQMFVTMRIGRFSFRALLDSGATTLSLPETGADGLIAAGAAVEGPQGSVKYADGIARPCRTIVINAVSVGKYVVHDVKSTVAPDTSIPLLGLGVLRAISGKIAIDTTHSQLIFE
jgi:hypothetical protein